jgi:Ca2+-binding EF-hand superfamily protein
LRGGKGVIGLERQFKLYDLSGSGTLDLEEFKKAVNDYKLEVDSRDLESLFKAFDKAEGKIKYDVLLSCLIGNMSEFRLNLVTKAFDCVDENEDGLVTIDELKKAYSPRFHPDIKSGKKTDEDVMNEFVNTFEMHHSLVGEKALKGGENLIPKGEFVTYYTKISAAIESDSYFDAMISGVWKLGLSFNTSKQPYAGIAHKIYQVDSKKSWVTDHHKNMMQPGQTKKQEEEEFVLKSGKGKGIYSPEEALKKPQKVEELPYDVKPIKEKIKARGIRGIEGIRRKFAVINILLTT